MTPDATGGVTPWLPPSAQTGAVPTDTNSLLASLYPGQQSQAQTAPTQQPQQHQSGNWFTRLLPTIGSTAAWGLGALLAPETGGLSLLGSAALSGLGGAAGKAAENGLEGQGIGNGVLSSGVEGGIGGIAGGVLGKIGGGIAGKVGDMFANRAANVAEKQTAADAANNLAQEFPEKALTPTVKTNLGFGGILDTAGKAGIPLTAQDFITGSQAATGSEGFLNGVLDDIVRNGGNVDLSKLGDTISSAIGNHPELGDLTATTGGHGGMPKVASNLATNTQKLFQNLIQQHGYGGEGSLTSEAEPDNALKLLRTIGSLGQKYSGAEPATPGAGLKDVYSTAYQTLKDAIYNRPTVHAGINAYTVSPEDMQGLLKATGGNQQLAGHLADIVNNAKSAQDILGPQSQFINMGKAGKLAQDYNTNVVGTSADAKAANAALEEAQPNLSMPTAAVNGMVASGGHPAGLLNMLVPAALRSSAVDAGSAVLGKLTSAGVPQKTAKLIAPALMGASQFVAHAPNYVPGAGSPISTTGETGMNQGQTTPQMGGGASPNEQLLQMALVGLHNPLYADTFAPIVQSLLTGPMQKANTANAALSSAENAFNMAGGGQGLIGGLLGKVGGALTGGPAGTYDASRQQLIAQLQALGLPTGAVPEITNTPGAANVQWQALQNLINSVTGGGGGAQGVLAGVQ